MLLEIERTIERMASCDHLGRSKQKWILIMRMRTPKTILHRYTALLTLHVDNDLAQYHLSIFKLSL